MVLGGHGGSSGGRGALMKKLVLEVLEVLLALRLPTGRRPFFAEILPCQAAVRRGDSVRTLGVFGKLKRKKELGLGGVHFLPLLLLLG